MNSIDAEPSAPVSSCGCQNAVSAKLLRSATGACGRRRRPRRRRPPGLRSCRRRILPLVDFAPLRRRRRRRGPAARRHRRHRHARRRRPSASGASARRAAPGPADAVAVEISTKASAGERVHRHRLRPLSSRTQSGPAAPRFADSGGNQAPVGKRPSGRGAANGAKTSRLRSYIDAEQLRRARLDGPARGVLDGDAPGLLRTRASACRGRSRTRPQAPCCATARRASLPG